MEIRPAVPDDVPAVLPMVEAISSLHESWDAAKYGKLANIGERYRTWLTTQCASSTAVFLVAEREEKLVAFLVATAEREIPIYRVTRYGFIHDLWVDEAYRHEGIARQMVMLAVERFKQIGVPQVRLETAAANDAARSLFTSCGFRVSAVSMLLEISP